MTTRPFLLQAFAKTIVSLSHQPASPKPWRRRVIGHQTTKESQFGTWYQIEFFQGLTSSLHFAIVIRSNTIELENEFETG
jgi:hypothetical protein